MGWLVAFLCALRVSLRAGRPASGLGVAVNILTVSKQERERKHGARKKENPLGGR